MKSPYNFRYTVFCALTLVLIWTLQSGLKEQASRLPIAGETDYLQDVLQSLGHAQRGDNVPRPVPGATAELGEQIIKAGIGEGGRRQSVHFVCTSCHNLVPEDPDLTVSDPAARLAFAEKNDLPFLPGTSLYGAIDRTSYYNDDYVKKYGDLVKFAQHDLRAAIQLCATECAQGKELTEKEMESVVLYLKTIGFKLQDLALNKAELELVNRALGGDSNRPAAIRMLNEKFLPASPATFLLPPEDRKAGYGSTGRPQVGKQIYERACLHCHDDQRYSFYELGNTQHFYDHLLRHFPRYTRYSTYQVVRYGTSPIPGKKAYMPHYTAERMSNQQVEDLRAFITSESSLK